MTEQLDARTTRLVHLAYWARRWFQNHNEGTGLNGQHDDVLLARQLTNALEAFLDDCPPMHDVDRQALLGPHQEAQRAELVARR